MSYGAPFTSDAQWSAASNAPYLEPTPGGFPYFGGAPLEWLMQFWFSMGLHQPPDAAGLMFAGQFSTAATPGGVTDTAWHHIAFSFRGSDNSVSAAIDGLRATVFYIQPPLYNVSKATQLLYSNWDDVLVSGVRIVTGTRSCGTRLYMFFFLTPLRLRRNRASLLFCSVCCAHLSSRNYLR